MKKFFWPLIVFGVGMFSILILFIFYPQIGQSADDAITEIGPQKMSAFTFLNWAMSSTRLLLFLGLLAAILITVAVVWLKRNHRF